MSVKIVKNLVSSGKYSIKCPYTMSPTRIVVHNTANDASARNEIQYMITNPYETSFHFAVDDKEIVQGIPLNRNAWHAGDGGTGLGNRQGIAIEICYSKSGGDKFVKAEKLAAKLIAQLLFERNWNINKVTKHQDYMDKYCPHRTLDMGWERFRDMCKKELDALKKENNAKPVEAPTKTDSSFKSYLVKVTASILNVRAGAGTGYKITTTVKKNEVYTIVGEKNGTGATKWLKLKSGAGYISSDWVKKI